METTASLPDVALANSPKRDFLLVSYRISSDEMSWRRTAGYRTIILGFAYCGVILLAAAYNSQMHPRVRECLAAIIALGTLFGASYLVSNYQLYMKALGRMVLIERYVGALDPDFLGQLGALMPARRADAPNVPLIHDPICIGSVIAFVIGGLLTAGAILSI